MNLTETRKQVNQQLGKYNAAKDQVKKESQQLEKAKLHLTHVEQAQDIAQKVSQEIQQKAHNQIAAVVSRCLKTVFFDKDYGFKIRFERKRGRTDANLILIKDGHEISTPLEADSGGVLDIASFALRLSSLMLSKPKLRRFLAMDEPFKNLSPKYQEPARLLIERLSSDFNFQFLQVTYEKAFMIGKVIEI